MAVGQSNTERRESCRQSEAKHRVPLNPLNLKKGQRHLRLIRQCQTKKAFDVSGKEKRHPAAGDVKRRQMR